MLIEGYYKPLDYEGPPAPYVRAAVLLPGLGDVRSIDFLIDTGADATCLHPRDVHALGIDPSILDPGTLGSSGGIGGSLDYYSHEAVLIFGESPNYQIWTSTIDICDVWSDPESENSPAWLPSLIGRDLLNLCDIHAKPAMSSFVLDPIRASGGLILPWDRGVSLE